MNENKIKLWTIQHNIVINKLKKEGVYYVKKRFIKEKYRESAHIFLKAYNYFVSKMKNKVNKPEKAEYPIWLTSDPERLELHPDHKIIELEIYKDKVVIFDEKKWNYILNLSYIPVDEKDAQKHKKKLKKYNLNDDSEAYLSDHYPLLKREIENSWDCLFDKSIRLSENNKAASWQLRLEWVKNINDIKES